MLSARQIEAAERFRTAYLELAACREELGDRHYRLLASVIGQERSLREIAADQRARLTAADNLRASLDDLADLWRIAPKKRPQNGKAA